MLGIACQILGTHYIILEMDINNGWQSVLYLILMGPEKGKMKREEEKLREREREKRERGEGEGRERQRGGRETERGGGSENNLPKTNNKKTNRSKQSWILFWMQLHCLYNVYPLDGGIHLGRWILFSNALENVCPKFALDRILVFSCWAS